MAKNNTQEALEEQLKADLEQIPQTVDESLSGLDLSEFGLIQTTPITGYTTELLDELQKINPTITKEEWEQLVNYISGKDGATRPKFMDRIITQNADKQTELLKVVSTWQLLQLPVCFDYIAALNKNLLNPENIKNMTISELADTQDSLTKSIDRVMNTALKIAQLTAENKMPSQAERITQAILGASENTVKLIQQILEDQEQ